MFILADLRAEPEREKVIRIDKVSKMPRQKPDRFDKVALELGHISIEWGRLEQDLNEFIELLIPLDPSQNQLNEAITGNIDLRSKLQMIRALAFLKRDDDEWFEIMLGVMDKIDNDLRVRRNSYIHARWYTPKGLLHRQTYRTKLLKPKAFSLILETKQIIPARVSELRNLRKALDDLIIVLLLLHWYMIPTTAEQGSSPNPFLRQSPEMSFRRYLLGVGSSVQRLRAYVKGRR